MFTGFTDETVQFLMDLKFHNNTGFFHEEHDRYVETVQKPFYAMIDDLAPDMLKIDPGMEVRPNKCLSRIHRDTRFSRDKSPYRDHHWYLFRRAGEPREKSLNYFFEFGPNRLNWGMGLWGENRELMDLFRKRMRADPARIGSILKNIEKTEHGLFLNGTVYKRIEVPSEISDNLKRWYLIREMYITKGRPDFRSAFSEKIVKDVRNDFRILAPLYQELRCCADTLLAAEKNDKKG